MDGSKKLLKNIVEKELSGGRLQSLKPPRDFTLGQGLAVKSKKQYAPNLNVVRNKDKTKEIVKVQKRRERPTAKGKQHKNDNNQRYLQSAGVFSQGSGEVKRVNQLQHEKRVSFKDSNSVSNIVLPTINRNTWNVTKHPGKVELDELVANCDLDSEEDKTAFAPLTLNKYEDKAAVTKNQFGGAPVHEPFNAPDLYSEEFPSLNLVKLPDSFAGKGLSDDPNCKKLFDYPLSGMLEGKIGRLIVRKSGRMEVEIGRIKYDLCPANTFESKEELVAVVEEGAETSMAFLGNVANNFVMFPNYELLLHKK